MSIELVIQAEDDEDGSLKRTFERFIDHPKDLQQLLDRIYKFNDSNAHATVEDKRGSTIFVRVKWRV